MSELLRRVGTRLKRLRNDRDWTQERLAEAAGLSYKFVGEVERGAANPTLMTLAALARALNVELVDLLADTYQYRRISPHDAILVREALNSIGAVIDRTGGEAPPTLYPRRRRR